MQSGTAIEGYHVHAIDGRIGHFSDLLVDEQSWAIRHLTINTGRWWVGRTVLVAPEWIDDLRWSDRSVTLGLSQKAIRAAPTYDSTIELNSEGEWGIHLHMKHGGYWLDDATVRSPLGPSTDGSSGVFQTLTCE